MGNGYRVEDNRDIRRRWNSQIREESKVKLGKELEGYINSGYTNHSIIEVEFYAIVVIRL